VSIRLDWYFDPAGAKAAYAVLPPYLCLPRPRTLIEKTSEMKGATVKDAHTVASLVRIPVTPTVIIPLSVSEGNKIMLIEVAARSKAWVYGRSLASIAGSNPAGGMDVLSLVSVCVCVCCVLTGRVFSAWG